MFTDQWTGPASMVLERPLFPLLKMLGKVVIFESNCAFLICFAWFCFTCGKPLQNHDYFVFVACVFLRLKLVTLYVYLLQILSGSERCLCLLFLVRVPLPWFWFHNTQLKTTLNLQSKLPMYWWYYWNFVWLFKDLPDGGASHFAETVTQIKKRYMYLGNSNWGLMPEMWGGGGPK